MKYIFILLLFIIGTVYPQQQKQEYPRIGYTTKYGNSFGQTTNNYKLYYNHGYHSTTYNEVYRPGIRKSKERPYSGNWIEDFSDWLRMQTDANWPSYVDDDYWEQFLSEYPEYADEAEEWFNNHGQTPPWQVPIGEPTSLLYILSIYTVFKRVKYKYRRKRVK